MTLERQRVLGTRELIPTRSTRPTRGGLPGPAATARQVRSITVQVDQLEPGVMRLSQPATPGWGGLARTPQQLAALVAAAFVEAQISAHAVWRGLPYEAADGKTYRRPLPARRGDRPDTHDPLAWTVAADGRWRDPGSGRLWRPDSQVVRRVKAKLARMGVPEPQPDAEASG